ncbi:hypothetical protein CY35_05G120000 [Sphagnum magellanicum]|nr:hypothetical protein CY35_05G120000 [Sphagnum magellanicum]
MSLVPCSPHEFQCNLRAQMMEEKSRQKEHDICFLTTFPNRYRDNPIQFPFPVANNPLQKMDTIEVGDGKLQKL